MTRYADCPADIKNAAHRLVTDFGFNPDLLQGAIASALHSERQGLWRPIETAPKDGTRILVFADGHPETMRYRADRSEAFPWMDDGGHSSWRADIPTHWMPLPPPANT